MDWSATPSNVSLSSKCQLLERSMQILKIGKVDRKAESSLSLLRSVLLSAGEKQNERLGYCSTQSLMFMSNPSQPKRTEERHKSNAQLQRDRETERVTNQTRSIAGTEGQSALQIKPTPSVGCRVKQITVTPSHLPLVRV